MARSIQKGATARSESEAATPVHTSKKIPPLAAFGSYCLFYVKGVRLGSTGETPMPHYFFCNISPASKIASTGLPSNRLSSGSFST